MLSLHRLIQHLAASRPGSHLFARILPPLDRRLMGWSDGRHSLAALATGLPILTLTTTGAKSGQARTHPLLYFSDPADPTCLVVIASNWGKSRLPAWYYNLKANPVATAVVDGRSQPYRATVVNGSDYDRLWQEATSIYVGFVAYRRRAGDRPIPIMRLEPAEPDTPF